MSVDLCFVMDCTGSMSSYIAACKKDINVTISKIVSQHPGTKIRLGFVAYRDHCDGANRIQVFPFNTDVQQFQYFVGNLSATGGGDWPEDVLGGLWEGTNLAWTSPTRVMFHIFDAPPHGSPKFHDQRSGDTYPDGHPNDKSTAEIFTKMRDNFMDYYMLKLTGRLDKMVAAFLADARAVTYEHIEERRGVGDVSQVMEAVGNAVLDSMAVVPSKKSRPRNRVDAIPQLREIPNVYKVFCGIDFGTHGSGYAFCSPGDPVVRTENDWGGSSVDVKTLTNVLLGPNRKCVPGRSGFGSAAGDAYLNMEEADRRSHYFFHRFKMTLYENATRRDDEKEGVDVPGHIVAENGKSVSSDVVLIEALTFMVKHVMTQIKRQHPDVTSEGEVQWILTVPAIWSQKSRRVMEKAAYEAGIPKGKHDQLMVALEPECASVVIQDSLNLANGECYMMIDCGGGTVDIACHELINNATEVMEIYQATGGPWGSTFIDDEFVRLLELSFGDEVMEEIEENSLPGLMLEIITNFDSAKRNATATESARNVNLRMIKPILLAVFGSGEAINQRLSQVTYRGVTGGIKFQQRSGMLCLSREIWDALFGVVIDPLVNHVKHLLNQPTLSDKLQTICVVGGFANSPILMKRFQDEFGGSRRVYVPSNPILTVVKGAAKYGLLPTTIAARTAPKTIGIAIRDEWKATDPEEKRKWVRGAGYMVDGVFFPFVKAGDSIPRDMPPVVRYFEPVNYESFQIEIYQSDDPDPRFVPETPCGVIGPVAFPPTFDHNVHDICVQIDFSGRMVGVKVQFGEEEVQPVEIDWE